MPILLIKRKKLFTLLLLFVFSAKSFSQEKTYNLSDLYRKGQLKVVNRTIKTVTEDQHSFIRVSEANGEGIVWLPIKNFKKGTLKVEMRGKNVLQKSFIGIAFHAKNDSVCDVVYCRPFNFTTKDSVRKIHAVQYVFHPKFTWDYLRKNYNSVYEKGLKNPPDPDGWFTMTLVIDKKSVKVFINDDTETSLSIQKISRRANGKVGIYTGDTSGGDFKYVEIKTASLEYSHDVCSSECKQVR